MALKKPNSGCSTDDTRGPNSNSSSSIIDPVYSQRTIAETVPRNYKPNTPIQNTPRAGKGTDGSWSPYSNVPSVDDPVSSQAEAAADENNGQGSSPPPRTEPSEEVRDSTSAPVPTEVTDPVYGQPMSKDNTPNQKTKTETGQGVGVRTINPADDPVYSQQQVEGNRNTNTNTTSTIIDPAYGQPRTSDIVPAARTPPAAKSGTGSISPVDDPVYSQPAQEPSSRGALAVAGGSGIGSRLSQLASQILPRSLTLLPVSANKQNPTGSARADPDPDTDTTGTVGQPKDKKG
ncbi:hypothetical protein KCU88_g4076, partial [Aureobasidium melanogenum]